MVKTDLLVISNYNRNTYKILTDRNLIIVDVFRACSTMVSLFLKGIDKIIPAKDLKHALHFFTGNEVLVGEKNGEKIEGFDCDNSPYQVMQMKLIHKTAILVSSGCTPAIVELSKNKTLLVASLLNISSIVQKMIDIGGKWALICAARKGAYHIEDKICCALIAEEYYLNRKVNNELRIFIDKYVSNYKDKLYNSSNAKYLRKIGKSEDVDFILSRINKYDIVPICSCNTNNNGLIIFTVNNNYDFKIRSH